MNEKPKGWDEEKWNIYATAMGFYTTTDEGVKELITDRLVKALEGNNELVKELTKVIKSGLEDLKPRGAGSL